MAVGTNKNHNKLVSVITSAPFSLYTCRRAQQPLIVAIEKNRLHVFQLQIENEIGYATVEELQWYVVDSYDESYDASGIEYQVKKCPTLLNQKKK